MATQPTVEWIAADWRSGPNGTAECVWHIRVGERHRGMAFTSDAATAEEAEAAAVACFIERFPNRLPDYSPPSTANNAADA